MERLLVGLAVLAALFLVLAAFSPTLKPKLDYCSEARRFAADVLAVYQGWGSVSDVYALRNVVVNASGVYSVECGVAVRAPTLNNTVLTGRVRCTIQLDTTRRAILVSTRG